MCARATIRRAGGAPSGQVMRVCRRSVSYECRCGVRAVVYEVSRLCECERCVLCAEPPSGERRVPRVYRVLATCVGCRQDGRRWVRRRGETERAGAPARRGEFASCHRSGTSARASDVWGRTTPVSSKNERQRRNSYADEIGRCERKAVNNSEQQESRVGPSRHRPRRHPRKNDEAPRGAPECLRKFRRPATTTTLL
jgi:hypothetical protein